MRRRIYWLALAFLPVVTLMVFEIIQLSNGYNGSCGLLDAGWDCSKSEYIFSVLFNPLVWPALLLYLAAWLLVLFIAEMAILIYLRQRRAKA